MSTNFSVPFDCNASFNGTNTVLPTYCCWFGVECCITNSSCLPNATSLDNCYNCTPGFVTGITLPANNLTGLISNVTFDNLEILSLLECNLRSLVLPYNELSGSIPHSLSGLSQLNSLNLGYNSLEGRLPPELGNLSALQIIALTRNNLSGPVPDALCQAGGTASPLTDFLISNNQLTGDLHMGICENLINIQAMGNPLNGSLLSLSGYSKLHIIQLFNCQLTGTIPNSIGDAELLADINLAQNRLTGTLPSNLSQLIFLTSASLNENHLTGTLPPEMFSTLGILSYLDISGNTFRGTIPESISLTGSLSYLDVGDNLLLTGTLPASLAHQLGNPWSYLNAESTSMSCCMVSDPTRNQKLINWSAWPLLPPGINFSTTLQPVYSRYKNVSDLSCPFLYNISTSNHTDDPYSFLDWELDPEYYLFYGCQCTGGSSLVNLSTASVVVFDCVPPSPPAPAYWWETSPWILVLVSIGAVAIIFTLYMSWLLVHRGSRPLFIQHAMDMRKRLKGPPQGGDKASIVVTDIQGFSNMMKDHPELMTEALLIHNRLIREAKWTNFGYTVEQEGDSYAIMFREPQDAVNFCIQVQLLLQQQVWPSGLLNEQPRENVRKKYSKSSSSVGTRLLDILSQAKTSFVASGLVRRNTGAGTARTGFSDHNFWGSRNRAAENEMFPKSDDQAPPPPLFPLVGESTRLDLAQVQSRPSAFSQNLPVIGLRVRMGIATGFLPLSSQPASSHVMEMAKVVSDAASGGQVLLCQNTFKAVQYQKEELGCVGLEGMDYKKFHALFTPWKLFSRRAVRGRREGQAFLLDMGEYVLCTSGQQLPTVLSPMELGLREKSVVLWNDSRKKKVSQSVPLNTLLSPGKGGPVAEARTSRFAASVELVLEDNNSNASPPYLAPASLREDSTRLRAENGPLRSRSSASSRQDRGELIRNPNTKENEGIDYKKESMWSDVVTNTHLRVYQVLSPALEDRGPYFGAKLALKEEWLEVDPPYYKAPGLSVSSAPRTSGSITFVTSLVEGWRHYSLLHWIEAQQVVVHLLALMKNALLKVPHGYLISYDTREMEFSLAFQTPQAALSWCLMLQESIAFLQWPASALRQWPEEVCGNGMIMFRGPRLKMGVFECIPDCIEPNEAGRAAYFGPNVGLASSFARAAVGGQVLCEASWADAVLDVWAEMRSLKSPLAATAPSATNPRDVSSVALNGGDIWSALSSNVPSGTPATTTSLTLTTPSISHQMPTLPALQPNSSLSGFGFPSSHLPSFLKQPLPTYQEEEESVAADALGTAPSIANRSRSSGMSAPRLSSMKNSDNVIQIPKYPFALCSTLGSTLGSTGVEERSSTSQEIAGEAHQHSLLKSAFQHNFRLEISEGSLTPSQSKLGVGLPLDSIPSASTYLPHNPAGPTEEKDDSSSIEESIPKKLVLAIRQGLLSVEGPNLPQQTLDMVTITLESLQQRNISAQNRLSAVSSSTWLQKLRLRASDARFLTETSGLLTSVMVVVPELAALYKTQHLNRNLSQADTLKGSLWSMSRISMRDASSAVMRVISLRSRSPKQQSDLKRKHSD